MWDEEHSPTNLNGGLEGHTVDTAGILQLNLGINTVHLAYWKREIMNSRFDKQVYYFGKRKLDAKGRRRSIISRASNGTSLNVPRRDHVLLGGKI